jgi:hypothetical protein
MLVVETIAKIRRAYFSLGKPIKEICRELHLSRKVVRKVIRSNATEFHYERSRQPLPRIGPWRQRLESLLEENESKAARERLTLVRLYEELRGLGFEGSYAAVRRYAIAWREKRVSATADAFVPLTFAPGEAYQFDWSHEIVVMDGVTTIVKVAHLRLCHSRMMFVRAYPRETQEMVFDAHERAFGFFNGACARGIYDNMKTALTHEPDLVLDLALLPARRWRASDRLDEMMRAHLQEAAIVLAILADEDRLGDLVVERADPYGAAANDRDVELCVHGSRLVRTPSSSRLAQDTSFAKRRFAKGKAPDFEDDKARGPR